MVPFLRAAAAALLLSSPLGAGAQVVPPPAATASPLSYADAADLVLAAPVIADATIRSATRIRGAEATGLAPGMLRFYVEADVTALIRGAAGLPPRIGYLLDTTPDARGRPPRLRRERVLLFARPAPGSGDQLQLVAADAQQGWSPALDAQVRGLAQAALAADAPPLIARIGSAFHVAGALPGEGETQIFLQTADARPVSLSVLRRPGERPRWSVALSEIVDEAAGPPARDTLLWYRLACGLPRDLGGEATAQLAPPDAEQAQQDYGFVLEQLGACTRTRTRGEPVVAGAPAVPPPAR